MASPTQILKLIIQGDTRGLRRELGKSLSNIRDFSSRAGNFFKNTRVHVDNLRTAITALGVGATIRTLVRSRLAIDSIESSLRVATGSSTAAAREFAFVRDEANRLGIDLQSTARDYSAFAAATKGTRLEGQLTRDIFTSVVETMTALGRSSDDTSGALKAIEQIVSKGNVQAEELRGQLGERLPGAFQIAARAMGITTQELNGMLDRGEVLADDLLPKLARELHNTFGPEAAARSGDLRAEIERLKTTFFEISSGTNLNGLTSSLRELREILQDPDVREGLDDILSGLVKVAEYTAKGGAAVGKISKGLGIALARAVSPNIEDRIKEVTDQIDTLQASIDDGRSIGERVTGIFNNFIGKDSVELRLAKLRQELSTLIEQKRELDSLSSPDQPRAADGKPFAPDPAGSTGPSPEEQKRLKSIADYIDALKDERATTEETRAEVVRYELAKLGADEATIKQAVSLANDIEAKKAAADAAKELADEERKLAEEKKNNLMADQDLIDGLAQLIEIESKEGEEKAVATQLARLSADATDQSRQEVERLARELYKLEENSKSAWGDMSTFADQAARNIQDQFADFLFNPFKKGLKGMVHDFAQTLWRMETQALSANILESLFPKGLSGAFASFFHTGGVIGKGGTMHAIDPMIFANAPKYHGGGVLGLRPDEVPIVGKLGEEMITTDDPRHRFNGAGMGASNFTFNLIDDPSRIGEVLSGPVGEKAIAVAISRNPSKFRNILGGGKK